MGADIVTIFILVHFSQAYNLQTVEFPVNSDKGENILYRANYSPNRELYLSTTSYCMCLFNGKVGRHACLILVRIRVIRKEGKVPYSSVFILLSL